MKRSEMVNIIAKCMPCLYGSQAMDDEEGYAENILEAIEQAGMLAPYQHELDHVGEVLGIHTIHGFEWEPEDE